MLSFRFIYLIFSQSEFWEFCFLTICLHPSDFIGEWIIIQFTSHTLIQNNHLVKYLSRLCGDEKTRHDPKDKRERWCCKASGKSSSLCMCSCSTFILHTPTFTHPTQYHLFTLLKGTLVALVQISLGLNVGFVQFIKVFVKAG